MTNEIHMFDEDENDALPSAKAQIIATSVKVSKVQSEYLLKNDIVRFQFLEYLLRCAIKKYFESGVCETELDAVKMMIENHIRKDIKSQFDQVEWRKANTLNVNVDNCLKAHAKVWDHMYSKFSGRHALPGAKPFMMCDEFVGFVEASGMINDCMTAKNVSYLFNLSMLTQDDEVKPGGQHLKATALEF